MASFMKLHLDVPQEDALVCPQSPKIKPRRLPTFSEDSEDFTLGDN